MEQHLVKIRKAMLESTFKDMEFSPYKKREVMQSIASVSNKKPFFFNKSPFLKPVLSIVACILFLGGSSLLILEGLNNQQTETSIIRSGQQINDSLLKLETTVGNERRIYKPVSIDKAKEAVIFNYGLPSYLPFSEKEPAATITEWFDDKNKISIDIKYVPNSTTTESRYVDLTVSNFPNVVSSIINNNEYHQEVTLGNNKAYLTKNKNVAMISWIDNNIEYDLKYYSFSNGDTSEELLKIAKSMQ